MTDLSFKEELSQLREDLRLLAVRLDTLFLMQVHVLAHLTDREVDDTLQEWVALRDRIDLDPK